VVTPFKREVVWSIEALAGLEQAYEYIKKDSPRSAQQLKQEVIDTIEHISINPNVFQVDRFMVNNKGEYRAFEIWSYRVTYKHTKGMI